MTRIRMLPILLVALVLAATWPGDAEAKRKKRRPPERSSQSSEKRSDKKSDPPAQKPEPARPAPASPQPASAAEVPAPPEARIADRIEFDERAVGGQTARPGTVRLFERRDSELRSMVHTRRSLRGAIVRSILGTQPTAQGK